MAQGSARPAVRAGEGGGGGGGLSRENSAGPRGVEFAVGAASGTACSVGWGGGRQVGWGAWAPTQNQPKLKGQQSPVWFKGYLPLSSLSGGSLDACPPVHQRWVNAKVNGA